MSEPSPVEARLTPTQDLFMEVMAARARLGETYWTFERRHTRVADSLQDAGLVTWRHDTCGNLMVHLTDAGRQACLTGDYVPPILTVTHRPTCCPVPHCCTGPAHTH